MFHFPSLFVIFAMTLDRDTEYLKIMLMDASLLDEQTKKWLMWKKKKTNDRKQYETVRPAKVTTYDPGSGHGRARDLDGGHGRAGSPVGV